MKWTNYVMLASGKALRPKTKVKFKQDIFFISVFLFLERLGEGEVWRSHQSTEVRCNGPERLKAFLSKAITPHVPLSLFLLMSLSFLLISSKALLQCMWKGNKLLSGPHRFFLCMLDTRTKSANNLYFLVRISKQFILNNLRTTIPFRELLFALASHLNKRYFQKYPRTRHFPTWPS